MQNGEISFQKTDTLEMGCDRGQQATSIWWHLKVMELPLELYTVHNLNRGHSSNHAAEIQSLLRDDVRKNISHSVLHIF